MTHLLALSAGGLFAAVIWPRGGLVSRSSAGLPERRSSLRPDANDSKLLSEARRQRNERILQDRIALVRRDTAIAAYADNEMELRRARRRDEIAEIGEKVARIEALSHSFRNVPDLNEALAGSILGRDKERLAAIFREWCRRDPQGAFDTLIQRPGSWYLLDEPAFTATFPAESLLAQLHRTPPLPESLSESLICSYGRLLAQREDLSGLQSAVAACSDSEVANDLASWFIHEWLPEDPGAAARSLIQSLRPEIRHVVLDSLIRESSTPPYLIGPFRDTLVSLDWAGDDGKKQDLDEERNTRSSCFPPASGDLSSILTAKEATVHLDDWSSFWQGDASLPDYVDLYGQGKLTPDQARDAFGQLIKGSERYPAEVDAAICKILFQADPEAVISWGKSKGLTSDMLIHAVKASSKNVTHMSGSEILRVSRAALQIEELEQREPLLDGLFGSNGFGATGREASLLLWREVNPDAANAAIQQLPEKWREAIDSP